MPLAYRARFAGRKVGLVLSGGNLDLDVLPALLPAAAGPTSGKIDGTRAHDRATGTGAGLLRGAFNRGDWVGMQALLAEDVVHDLN